MTLDQYMARRRWWEGAMLLGFILMGFSANIAVEMMDSDRLGHDVPLVVPVITCTWPRASLGSDVARNASKNSGSSRASSKALLATVDSP